MENYVWQGVQNCTAPHAALVRAKISRFYSIRITAARRLSFNIFDPGLPELISDDESDSSKRTRKYQEQLQHTANVTAEEVSGSREVASPLKTYEMSQRKGNVQAFQALMRVKQQNVSRPTSRPDNWLVYDPKQMKLVMLKDKK